MFNTKRRLIESLEQQLREANGNLCRVGKNYEEAMAEKVNATDVSLTVQKSNRKHVERIRQVEEQLAIADRRNTEARDAIDQLAAEKHESIYSNRWTPIKVTPETLVFEIEPLGLRLTGTPHGNHYRWDLDKVIVEGAIEGDEVTMCAEFERLCEKASRPVVDAVVSVLLQQARNPAPSYSVYRVPADAVILDATVLAPSFRIPEDVHGVEVAEQPCPDDVDECPGACPGEMNA